MAAKKPTPTRNEAPDQRLVTERQAAYLSKIASVPQKEIAGKTIAKVIDQLRWRVDPSLLLFRRICGRVVKPNPTTGDLEPVPNATVHVEDTDCSFFGFFPVQSPFYWLFPFHCRREEITTVVTDACGKFCVYIPYWDVDRYWRFRLNRICFPEIVKPSIRDILNRPLFEPPEIKIPFPEPDPRVLPEQIERIRAVVGPQVAERLEQTADLRELGGDVGQLNGLLDTPAFTQPLPPPLPANIRRDGAAKSEELEGLAAGMPDQAKAIRAIDFNRYLGPFVRCRDILVPTWTTFLDVPDLTFRVTQDIDADGNEETIYSEGFFDVRWNAPNVLNVTLTASEHAISVPHCEPIPGIDCQDDPAIITAGYMPLEPTHHDNTDGVGIRVNRPRPPDGRSSTPQSGLAHAPYCRTLNLHGCQRLGGATHYRLTYAVKLPDATAFTAPVPFAGLKWWAPRLGPGAPILIAPNADGWYSILPAASLAHPNWLLSWPTHAFANGLYEVRLELGKASGGSISVTDTSAPERFLVDNTKPTLRFEEIRWRPASIPVATPWTNANSTLLPTVCPVITRMSGTPIHIQVAWAASAAHLRNAYLSAAGCGAGGLSFVTGEDTYRHWHIDKNDNDIAETATLLLPGNRPAGCYHLRLDGWGRQFNPSGFDYGPALNWLINQGSFSWSHAGRAISLVNA